MPPIGWFVDADVLGLYHVLKAARRSTTDDVYSGLTDGFPVSVGMLDAIWMPLLKEHDLAILTKDARQRFRDTECEAIRSNSLGIFARPFVYHLIRSGGLTRVL